MYPVSAYVLHSHPNWVVAVAATALSDRPGARHAAAECRWSAIANTRAHARACVAGRG